MKKFHELKHAADNNGIDEWYEEIGKVVQSFNERDIDAAAEWLTANMELYRRDVFDNVPPIPAKDEFTLGELTVVRALYYGVLKGCVFCGCVQSRDDFGKAGVATNAAEFAFLVLHPDFESYRSFYVPLANVVGYMQKNAKKLNAST